MDPNTSPSQPIDSTNADTFPIPLAPAPSGPVPSAQPAPVIPPELDLPVQPEPVVQPIVPTSPPASTEFNPPAFQNPLAAGHEAHTQELPAIPTSYPSVSQPAAPVESSPQASPTPSVSSEEPTATAPLYAEPAPVPPVPLASYPAPAPVRLAPEPRADDFHGAVQAQTAATTPFGSNLSAPPVSNSGVPVPPPPGSSKRLPIIAGVVVGVIVLVLIGWFAQGLFISSDPKTEPTPSPTAMLRNQSEQPLQPGLSKAETACYVLQVPANPTINANADCKLDLVYGEQKTSSIVVSTYRDFDLVTPTGETNEEGKRFDSDAFLKDLIANTTSGKTVISQESIKVANLPAEKIIVGEADKPSTQVAYVYIVLPESDQQFSEKKFIAFIITGAYNDAASQQGFDNALKLWYWK